MCICVQHAHVMCICVSLSLSLSLCVCVWHTARTPHLPYVGGSVEHGAEQHETVPKQDGRHEGGARRRRRCGGEGRREGWREGWSEGGGKREGVEGVEGGEGGEGGGGEGGGRQRRWLWQDAVGDAAQDDVRDDKHDQAAEADGHLVRVSGQWSVVSGQWSVVSGQG